MGSSFISEAPDDSILESLYRMRIRMCDQLRTVLAMYEQEINQDQSSKPSCQKVNEYHGKETYR